MMLFASLLWLVSVLPKTLLTLQEALYYVRTFLPLVLGFLD